MAPIFTALTIVFLFTGSGTHYVGPTDTCHDGTRYHRGGQWVAVNEDLYPELVGKTLLVYGEDRYCYAQVRDSHRGWHVADFPIEFYEGAFGTLDTQHGLNAYLIESKRPYKHRRRRIP